MSRLWLPVALFTVELPLRDLIDPLMRVLPEVGRLFEFVALAAWDDNYWFEFYLVRSIGTGCRLAKDWLLEFEPMVLI